MLLDYITRNLSDDVIQPFNDWRLTEHGLQPHQAADEAVKVDVHALVGVAHGDDVVQLVVETVAWTGHKTHDCTPTRTQEQVTGGLK